jgi:hypothetical protein
MFEHVEAVLQFIVLTWGTTSSRPNIHTIPAPIVLPTPNFFGPFKEPWLIARARPFQIKALLLSIGSNHAELQIYVLCLTLIRAFIKCPFSYITESGVSESPFLVHRQGRQQNPRHWFQLGLHADWQNITSFWVKESMFQMIGGVVYSVYFKCSSNKGRKLVTIKGRRVLGVSTHLWFPNRFLRILYLQELGEIIFVVADSYMNLYLKYAFYWICTDPKAPNSFDERAWEVLGS